MSEENKTMYLTSTHTFSAQGINLDWVQKGSELGLTIEINLTITNNKATGTVKSNGKVLCDEVTTALDWVQSPSISSDGDIKIDFNLSSNPQPQTNADGQKIPTDEEKMALFNTRLPTDNTFKTRTANCLKNDNIVYVGDLVKMTEGEVLRIPNLGRKGLNELKSWLEFQDLHLGMDICGWKPPK